ncbi:hypothetical protein IC614_01115 [Allosphingosinicella flava]|uniref:YMGG-like Gly-zipper domain-containing protein n=1 Tax=Allosphingosinicella flava TaxID=2771430 RepID=A0A7T2GJY5_9SPHN|nr:YMGG-like glycine zipper-containing protein [Sphingosinicella flava]QPQ55249.1 hypothetical protein IC614_01115 [Sphingosinicella flava]
MKKSVVALFAASALSLGACSTTESQDEMLASAGTGAAIGAAAGAGVGAVVGGLSPIEGAAIGAAVGGLAGAIWADRDNDGQADGYYQNGTYYEGRPPASATQPAPVYQQPAPTMTQAGERG